MSDPERRKAELMEWLGLNPADLMVYASIAAVVALYFVSNQIVDAILSVAAIALAAMACPG